ncbi:metal ABC transporter solute-binding protein, Zn/Mn family [Guptibacillus hwajinpoensis]|uniref:Zinc transport system substrate-binding protein n=1 Tax=Guptibacillus hwajinpoensis TaxID=208199 RepID=A0ABU0K670_9BACL|nr:zinc ABC transporter substrate-binding protein [Alkalihalobacillus hemicentroti]MDQ0484867.1 zinc transport system substrate-binding protein [Alkalihalobacillus hemicentroti]
MIKKSFKVMALLSITSLLLMACSPKDSDSKNEDTIDIYTTLYPLEYFAERIGGNDVNAESIIPPGSDAHSFEPTTKTMTKLAESDIFIYNGAGMEGFAEAVKETLQKEDVTVLETAEGIHFDETEEEHEDHADEESHDGHEHGDINPHLWIDPILSIQLAENIKNTLVDTAPEKKEMFEENFIALKDDLLALDESFKDMASNAPKKEFLISHDAYSYWESRYGLNQLSVSGLSPSQEPTQKQLEDIIEKAESHNISYMLFEQNATPKPAKAVQQELGLETLRIHNLSVLSEKDIENNETYLTLMEKNIETMKKALAE